MGIRWDVNLTEQVIESVNQNNGLVRYSNGRKQSGHWMVCYSDHHLNRGQLVSVLLLRPLFEWFRYSNVRYLDPHCIFKIHFKKFAEAMLPTSVRKLFNLADFMHDWCHVKKTYRKMFSTGYPPRWTWLVVRSAGYGGPLTTGNEYQSADQYKGISVLWFLCSGSSTCTSLQRISAKKRLKVTF